MSPDRANSSQVLSVVVPIEFAGTRQSDGRAGGRTMVDMCKMTTSVLVLSASSYEKGRRNDVALLQFLLIG